MREKISSNPSALAMLLSSLELSLMASTSLLQRNGYISQGLNCCCPHGVRVVGSTSGSSFRVETSYKNAAKSDAMRDQLALEALAVHNRRTRLMVLLLRDPH